MAIFCLYHILPALGAETSEPLVGRLLYALDHDHKITPLHLIALRVLIILRQFEASCFQALHIHYHTPVLGMEELHQLSAGTDEDKHVAIAHIAPHLLVYHAAEGADALTHIRPSRAQPIAHRIIQAEHGQKDSCSTIPEVRLQYHCQSGRGDRWEKEEWRQKGQHL